MISRTKEQLREQHYQRTKPLTKEILKEYFTEEQLATSTYSNRTGTHIRLTNSKEHEAFVPSLYKYNKQYIVYLQQTYSNVGPLNSENANNSNKKLDATLTATTDVALGEEDTRVNPPLPTNSNNSNSEEQV